VRLMTRRSQMEIYMDILRAVAEGRRRPTHIMYRANLSWARLRRYLNFLVKQGLLEEDEDDSGSTLYSITLKGKDVLGYFKKIEGELYYRKRALPTEISIHYK